MENHSKVKSILKEMVVAMVDFSSVPLPVRAFLGGNLEEMVGNSIDNMPPEKIEELLDFAEKMLDASEE